MQSAQSKHITIKCVRLLTDGNVLEFAGTVHGLEQAARQSRIVDSFLCFSWSVIVLKQETMSIWELTEKEGVSSPVRVVRWPIYEKGMTVNDRVLKTRRTAPSR